MTENSYIELWSSDEEIGGKFAVVRDGYQHVISKKTTVKETMEGGIDVTMGGIREVFVFTIRVLHTDSRDGYGTLSDLRELYELNNPGGDPSNVITFTDHEENEMNVYLIGDFQERLIGCKITGSNAMWFVQIVMRKIPS